MSKRRSASAAYPHLDHLLKIGQLQARGEEQELLRYRDEGLIIQKFGKEKPVAKKKSDRAKTQAAPQPTTFTGQGIIYAVIDNREEMERGATTVDTIADAIEAALDAGHETSEEIARFLTTSAFQHVPDKRVRFNSVLKAGDAVGAQMTRKLLNAYNDLALLAEEEEDPQVKKDLISEARGFAGAVSVVMSPFSCEDPQDPRLVNWDEVDRITDAFEKEQRLVRRERKGNPQ